MDGPQIGIWQRIREFAIDPPDACTFADRCPHAMRICRQKDPGYFTPVEGSRTACWLHHPRAQASLKTFLETRFGHDRAA